MPLRRVSAPINSIYGKIVITLLLNLKSGKGMISREKQIISRGSIGEDVALRNLFYAVLFSSLLVLTSIKYVKMS